MSRFNNKPRVREFILPTDRLLGHQPLRTDYSAFDPPTCVRRMVERIREKRGQKQ